MKTNLSLLSAALFAALAFAACDPKDKGGEGSKLTPDENKEKLEQIALDFANIVKAADFTDFTDAVNRIKEVELPEDFQGEEDAPLPNPAGRISQAGVPLFFGKFDVLTRANGLATRAADYAASDLYGIYTWDEESVTDEFDGWTKEESTEELTFEFNFEDGEVITLTGKASGTETEVTVEGKTVVVPASASFKIAKGSATLAEVAIGVPSINDDATVGKVITSVSLCGYTFATTTNVTTSKIDLSVNIKKGSQALLDVTASLSGSNLTSIETIEVEEYGNTYTEVRYKGTPGAASGTVNIMGGKIFLKGSSANLQNIIDELEELFDKEDEYDSEQEYYKEYSSIWNKNLNVFMNYDGSNNPIAKLEFDAVNNYDYNGDGVKDFYSAGHIVFANDGSKYLFEDYFNEDDFSEVIDAFEELGRMLEDTFGYEADDPLPNDEALLRE
jgi:hypothetical protein